MLDPNETLVQVMNVQRRFPIRRSLSQFLLRKPPRFVRAVDGVSFDIKRGEIFVLAGESGCGKTTTARLLVKALEPDSGQIFFEDRLVSNFFGEKLREFRKKVQMIFQDPYASTDPRFTVFDCLAEPLIVHEIGPDKKTRMELITQAMEDTRLVPPDDLLRRYPHMLSGGQRQRLAIARALILNPKFIIADEPVSMLDLSIRAEILGLMESLRRKYQIACLYITHDLSTARYVADRIAIMYLGKIVEMGTVERIIEKPLHPYTQALIDAVPEPDPSNRLREKTVRIQGEVPSAVNVPSGCSFHPRCPYRFDSCVKEIPDLREVEPSHWVSCFLH